MRRTVLVLASVALAMLLTWSVASGPPAKAQTVPVDPNFVFILADDMRKDDLKYMSKTRALLQTQGMQFQNAFVSNPVCCPSRATIMRGQYAHNTGVWHNINGPNGGWQGYKNHGNEEDNVATRLHDAGYRTGLFGKYFNGYGYDGSGAPTLGRLVRNAPEGGYFDYQVNDNGTKKYFGKSDSDYSHRRPQQGNSILHRRQRWCGQAVLRLRRAQTPARTGHPSPAPRQHLRRREGSALAFLQRERHERQTPFDAGRCHG